MSDPYVAARKLLDVPHPTAGRVRLRQAYASRRATFEAALAQIKAHNARTDSSYKMGLSMHTDKTDVEWATQMKGYNRHVAFATHAARPPALVEELPPDDELPDRVDWRESNVVTDVKDQGTPRARTDPVLVVASPRLCGCRSPAHAHASVSFLRRLRLVLGLLCHGDGGVRRGSGHGQAAHDGAAGVCGLR